MMKVKRGFTLAEVLITLAIIGVVAAMAIPSVIVNTQQQEFKTGLKKAVSVLNSAIQMNIAIDGMSPADIKYLNGKHSNSLMGYFASKMAVTGINNSGFADTLYGCKNGANTYDNWGFYTTDGMRYEFTRSDVSVDCEDKIPVLYENDDIQLKTSYSGPCGSYGLDSNDKSGVAPCLMAVDVNGDKKPSVPGNLSEPQYYNDDGSTNSSKFGQDYKIKVSSPDGSKLSDMFTIMITDKAAVPFGTAAQRAMYGATK